MIDDADGPGPRQRSPLEDPAELSRLDARILAAYRREFGGRRSRSASLRVPLPVAAAVLAALLVCATLVVRGRAGGGNATQPSAPPEAPVQVQVRHDAPLVTNTSLAGFEPVDEMQVIVVRGGQP